MKWRPGNPWAALTAGVFLFILAGPVGCGEEPAPEKPATRPPVVDRPLGPVAGSAPVERAYPVTAETRAVYQWYCAQCHGVHGKGDGINAPHTAVPPRDHTKADYLETRSDEQLFHVIKNGGLAGGRAPCMPRWGHTLDDATIHSLVSYIRELCRCEAL